jgi:hypothetical protein
VVEPISVGVVVAALLAKALNRAEDGVVDGGFEVAQKAIERLRQRFSREGDTEAAKALENLVDVPGGEGREKSLAALLEERAARSTELGNELKAIIEQGEEAGMAIGSIEQVAEGDGNSQVGGISNSEININQNPGQPRS